MNNPYSTDPRLALYPSPERCAGWNLWQMVNDVCGISRLDWVRRTDRRNLLNERAWDPLRARAAVEGLWRTLEGRQVAVLGGSARAVLWLPVTPPVRWTVTDGVRWCLIPHPSGRNHFYNESLHRLIVGLRLEEMIGDA